MEATGGVNLSLRERNLARDPPRVPSCIVKSTRYFSSGTSGTPKVNHLVLITDPHSGHLFLENGPKAVPMPLKLYSPPADSSVVCARQLSQKRASFSDSLPGNGANRTCHPGRRQS